MKVEAIDPLYLIAGDIPVGQEFELPCEFLLEVVPFTIMGTLKQLSNFIVADDLNAIKLLYQDCKSNLLIRNLPALSCLTLEVDEVARGAFTTQLSAAQERPDSNTCMVSTRRFKHK